MATVASLLVAGPGFANDDPMPLAGVYKKVPDPKPLSVERINYLGDWPPHAPPAGFGWRREQGQPWELERLIASAKVAPEVATVSPFEVLPLEGCLTGCDTLATGARTRTVSTSRLRVRERGFSEERIGTGRIITSAPSVIRLGGTSRASGCSSGGCNLR